MDRPACLLAKLIATLLCLSFLMPLPGMAQKSPAAKAKTATARFIVKATYEENYKAVSSTPNESLNHESKLKADVEASRWILIGKNDVGNVEIQDLSGGQPPTAGGNVSLNAVFDSKSSNGSTVHAVKAFNGPLAAEHVGLSIPNTTELGEGFGFNLEIHNTLKGSCKAVVKSNNETINTNDCSDPAGSATGLGSYGENTGGKTPETPSAVSYGARFEILPALFDIAKLKAAGELNSTDPFAQLRLARLEEAYQQKENPFSNQRWFGAATVGNSQSGYKINLTLTKDHPTNDSEQQWTQKLTVTADIIPGGTTGVKKNDEVLDLFGMPLLELSEE